MDWDRIREAVDVLDQEASAEADCDSARALLCALTEVDHGRTASAWQNALAPRLEADVATALRALGLYDAERFRKQVGNALAPWRSLRFRSELATFLRDAAPNVYVRKDLAAYLESGPPSPLDFADRTALVTGHRPTFSVTEGSTAAPRALTATLDTVRHPLRRVPHDGYALLCAWAAARRPTHRFCVTVGWSAYLLTPAQLDRLRAWDLLQLRAVDPVAPGRPTLSTRAAMAALAAAGVQVMLSDDVLGWELVEAGLDRRESKPRSPGLKSRPPEPTDGLGGTVAQLLALAQVGVAVRETGAHPHGLPLNAAIGLLADLDRAVDGLGLTVVRAGVPRVTVDVAVRGATERLEWDRDLAALLEAINARLDGMHLVAYVAPDMSRHGVARIRVAALPPSTAAALGRTGALLYAVPEVDAAPEPVAPAATPRATLEGMVGDDRLLVGDGECVGNAAEYADVVRDLCRLAGVRAVGIQCTERSGRRTLTTTVWGATVRADLEGDTDWLDLPPLLAALNRALPGPDRLVEVRDPAWGQEFGVAFASPAMVDELRALGFLV